MEAIQFWWALFREDPESYIMGGNSPWLIDLDKLPAITPLNTEYNQLEFKEFGSNMCTCYAWIGSLNNCVYIPNEIERHQVSKIRYTAEDFNPSVWGYLDKGINIVNDYFKRWVVYKINKRYAKNLLEKGYYVNIGMYVGWDVTVAWSDWMFTSMEIEKIVNAKYWHSTLLVNKKRQNSYKWVKKHNVVEVEDIDKFLKSWFVYENAYVIVPNYVIRDMFRAYMKDKKKSEVFEFYDKLYDKEKLIFQYCLQEKYIGKINTQQLKELKF